MGGGPSTRSQTSLDFEPETLQALGIELMAQIGQLDPVQREQLVQAIGLTINQPGAQEGATRVPETPPGPGGSRVGQGFLSGGRAASTLNLDPTQTGQIIEGLRGMSQQGRAAQRNQGANTVAGVTSFIDPRVANQLQPTQTSSSSTTPGSASQIQTGIGAAGAAVGIAALVVA